MGPRKLLTVVVEGSNIAEVARKLAKSVAKTLRQDRDYYYRLVTATEPRFTKTSRGYTGCQTITYDSYEQTYGPDSY